MEAPQGQKCTNCKVTRDSSFFTGKDGNPVKRCQKCRDKDDRQKQRPEVMERRNEVQREKQYYKAYREKKRSENEEEYLQHNAEVARAWRAKNKEKESDGDVNRDSQETGPQRPTVITIHTNLPDDFPINPNDIPRYCHYIKASDGKADGFCCGRHHPKQKESGKDWKTTRSKKVSIKDKFKQLLDYVNAP